MSIYLNDIAMAAVAFPFVAFALTLPYLVYSYRRFGSIPPLRTFIVFSFVFYLMCALALVILPLPADRSAFMPSAAAPQLVPFDFAADIARESGLSLSDPATWLAALRHPSVYVVLFNVLLFMPLGMYLRYYFSRSWQQTLALGFALTLFFELTQLTGLWGIYAHPYRLADVDDLILNTAGAMAGWCMVGPFMHRLPDLQAADARAYAEGLRAGATRRALSFGLDLVIAQTGAMATLGLMGALGVAGIAPTGMPWGTADSLVVFAAQAICLAVVPIFTKGQTPGQAILKLRIVRPDASRARWYQYGARYGLLYLLATVPFVVLVAIESFGAGGTPGTGMTAVLADDKRAALLLCWLAAMAAWAASLMVRAVRSAVRKTPFVMLNGLLSNTRVMTCHALQNCSILSVNENNLNKGEKERTHGKARTLRRSVAR